MVEYEKIFKYNEKIDDWMKQCFPINEYRSLLPLLESKFGEIYIFKNEGMEIGFAALININNISHIIYLAVVPKFQNLGYGTKILKLIKQIKKGNNIVVDLEDPYQENITEQEKILRHRRINFYKRIGFINMSIYYEWSNIKYLIYTTKFMAENEFWRFWKNSKGLNDVY